MQYLLARIRHRLDVFLGHQAARRVTHRAERALHTLRQARGHLHLRLAVYLRHEADGSLAFMLVSRPASGASEELREAMADATQEVVDAYNAARRRNASSLPAITEILVLQRPSLPQGRTVGALLRRCDLVPYRVRSDGQRPASSDQAEHDSMPSTTAPASMSGSDPGFRDPPSANDAAPSRPAPTRAPRWRSGQEGGAP